MKFQRKIWNKRLEFLCYIKNDNIVSYFEKIGVIEPTITPLMNTPARANHTWDYNHNTSIEKSD